MGGVSVGMRWDGIGGGMVVGGYLRVAAVRVRLDGRAAYGRLAVLEMPRRQRVQSILIDSCG